ncbi:protein MEMO1-like isoform X1 [Haliotis rubra]|uniref:protein MEMO1-like isoform X1 n=1 Tax=Haliotis rubra TaxID=36100 RepID=UPI001EE5D6D6|nr:protein MEMO1-like isoform X1 [Haliotis rubra]
MVTTHFNGLTLPRFSCFFDPYEDDLRSQLGAWLGKVKASHLPARAIIAPHAGYSYCGACSAYAYRQIDPTNIKRIFILGPSHHVRLSGCALSAAERYQTPLYDLPIDTKVYEELYSCATFETMSLDTDQDEHSLEMQLPYIAMVMESRRGDFSVVPVLVGSLSPEKEQYYGNVFSRYLTDPDNLFIISSDFCHWGRRFHYTYFDKSCGEICQSIAALDRKGMNIIESMQPAKFTQYLAEYQNTICGRHPIGVLLNAIETVRRNGNGYNLNMKFLKYAQSSECTSASDSSVSYAAGVLFIE